jgi:hypothetical protein
MNSICLTISFFSIPGKERREGREKGERGGGGGGGRKKNKDEKKNGGAGKK